MKCRDGCEGVAVARPVCWECWERVPVRLVSEWFRKGCTARSEIDERIRDWLAADDTRRG